MKKIISLALILMTLVFFSGTETNAQMRIRFAKGKNSATVRGNTGRNGVYYTVRARGGQKIALNLSPASKVGVKVERGRDEVLLREERGGFYEVYLEEGGDISIFVGSTNGQSVPFALSVKITNMTDI
jgi:hypothetical protein